MHFSFWSFQHSFFQHLLKNFSLSLHLCLRFPKEKKETSFKSLWKIETLGSKDIINMTFISLNNLNIQNIVYASIILDLFVINAWTIFKHIWDSFIPFFQLILFIYYNNCFKFFDVTIIIFNTFWFMLTCKCEDILCLEYGIKKYLASIDSLKFFTENILFYITIIISYVFASVNWKVNI